MSFTSISQLLRESLSHKGMQWLHCDNWNDEHKRYFALRRQRLSTNLIKFTPAYRTKVLTPWTLGGPWLLKTSAGDVCGWAELQIHTALFKTGVLIAECHDGDEEGAAEALNSLIGMMFVLGASDELMVCDVSSNRQLTAHLDQWFQKTSLWTLGGGAKNEKLTEISSSKIDKPTWWQTPMGLASKASLNLLERRISREQKLQEFAKAERRQHWLIRLLRSLSPTRRRRYSQKEINPLEAVGLSKRSRALPGLK